LVGAAGEGGVPGRLRERSRRRGRPRAGGRQPTAPTHVLAAVGALNRLELVRETVRHALDVLAELAPDWLRARARPDRVTRYRGRGDDDRLPKGKEAQRALADVIGADGAALLAAAHAPNAPPWLRAVPAVEMVRRGW